MNTAGVYVPIRIAAIPSVDTTARMSLGVPMIGGL